jgi:hypothetical protein
MTAEERLAMHNEISIAVTIGLVLMSGCSQSSPPGAATTGPGSNERPQSAANEGTPPLNREAAPSLNGSSSDSVESVEVGGVTLAAPASWERIAPGSSILAAEFVLPRSEGDDADGRLTISTAGGSVEANIDRWKGQFNPQPQNASQEEIDVAGLKITIVDYSGDFNDQRGPFAPPVKRSGYRMIAAIIPDNGQLHFIKATGPQKTIAASADAIHAFIRSARTR